MPEEYKGLYVKFGADTTSLNAALRDINREARTTQTQLSAVQRALKFQPGNTTLLAQQMQQLEKRIDQTKTKLETLKQAQAQLGERTDLNAGEWDRLEREIADTENVLKRYNAQLDDTRAKMSALGQAGTAVTEFGKRIEGAGQKVANLGDTWTRTVTAGIVGGGALAVRAAVGVDTALTGVKKTLDATDDEYEQLKRSAIEFSKTNAVTADQILDIQTLGAQLGYSKSELKGFAETVSGLDIATDLDAEKAATEVAQFSNIMGTAHDKTSNLGSAIVALGNNFATTESSVMDMGMRVAAAGRQANMSEGDVLGLSAAMSSLGIEAEAGGTAISTTISGINKDVATNGENLKTWAGLASMSVDEFKRAWGTDAAGTFTKVIAGMQGVQESGGNLDVMLEQLGITGIRQTDVMKRLASNSGLLSDAIRVGNSAFAENTALQKEVANRNESLAAKFMMLQNRVTAVAIEIGEPLADALLDAVDAAEPLFQAIEDGAKAFSEMSEEEQRGVIQTLAMVAAMGPLLSILGRGMQAVKGLGEGMSTLAKVQTKIGSALDGYRASTASATAATGEMTAAEGAASAGAAGLSATMIATAAGVGILAVALAGVIKLWLDEQEAQRKFESSLQNLENSTAIPVLESTAQGIEGITDAADGYESIDEMTRSMNELSSAMQKRYQQASGEISQLQGYMDTIVELGGKSDLTAEQAQQLRSAVDHVNESCGTSAKVLDGTNRVVYETNGAYEDATASLQGYVTAKQAQIRVDAYSATLTDLYTEQAEAQADMAAKAEEAAEAHRKLAEAQAAGANPQWVNQLEINADKADKALGMSQERLDAVNGSIGKTTRAMSDNEAVARGEADAWQKLAAEFPALRDQFADDDAWRAFQKAVEGCGMSVDKFAALNQSDQMKIIQAFDGTNIKISQTNAALLGLSAVKIDDKHFFVSDDGTIYDETGKTHAFDSIQINGKHYYVTDDGYYNVETGKTQAFNAIKINGKHYYVSDDGTIYSNEMAVGALSGDIRAIPDENFWVDDDGSINGADGRIGNLAYDINTLPDGSIEVHANTDPAYWSVEDLKDWVRRQFVTIGIGASQGATGAFIPAHSQVREWARGFATVLTKPTVVRMDGMHLDIGGEAGAEYWEHGADGSDRLIPLTNRRYMSPIAKEIAVQLADRQRPQRLDYDRMGREMSRALDGMEISLDSRQMGRFVRRSL